MSNRRSDPVGSDREVGLSYGRCLCFFDEDKSVLYRCVAIIFNRIDHHRLLGFAKVWERSDTWAESG